jgi:RimJ/RimL family protein N-acetyltransferase
LTATGFQKPQSSPLLNKEDLIAAPRQLQTPRLLLVAPRPELQAQIAAAFVESLNLSLPGLHFISWGQKTQTLEWSLRFVPGGWAYVERGEDLIFYAFERDAHDAHAEAAAADGAGRALGTYVGRVDLHSWDFSTPRCEVGYVGDVRTAGRGLMREAVLACVDLAFSLGAVRVQALSEANNHHALRFAEQALGFTREGVLRHYERDAQGNLGEQVMFAAYPPPPTATRRINNNAAASRARPGAG